MRNGATLEHTISSINELSSLNGIYKKLFIFVSTSVICRKQARLALEFKVQSAFDQAFELQERLLQHNEEKMKQRALCEQLALQVKHS
jgi:hypothetical protein